MALGAAVSHGLDAFNVAPRLIFTSSHPQSGKTSAMMTVGLLSNNMWKANPTQYALKGKYEEADTSGRKVTPVLDEISKVFGENGKRQAKPEMYQVLVEGYTRDGNIAVQRNGVPVDVSCFGMVLMSGLRTAAPEDLRQRSIRFLMQPKPKRLRLEDYKDAGVRSRSIGYRDALHGWVRARQDSMQQFLRQDLTRIIHPELGNRDGEIWGPLFAVANAAGNDWPARCLAAFLAMVTDDAGTGASLIPEEQILLDASDLALAYGSEHLVALDVARHLYEMPDKAVYQGMTERQVALLMATAIGHGPSPVRDVKSLEGKLLKSGDQVKAYKASEWIAKASALRAELCPPVMLPERDALDDELDVDLLRFLGLLPLLPLLPCYRSGPQNTKGERLMQVQSQIVPAPRASALFIQPSQWGWSLYEAGRVPEGELSALVSSSDDLSSLVQYAVRKLSSEVTVHSVPHYFLDGNLP